MIEESRPLEQLLRELPSDLQEEIRDFAEFLLQKRANRPRRRPSFSWAGALSDLRGQYTSVDLQHTVAEWRTEEE